MDNYDIITSGSTKIIRCVSCILRYTTSCPMRHEEYVVDPEDGMDIIYYDFTNDDGFCDCGKDEWDDGEGGFED